MTAVSLRFECVVRPYDVMGNIVRVVTGSQVYSIGHRLPVPEGFPPEPFVISSIQLVEDDEGREVIEFACTPDEDSANKAEASRDTELTDEQWENLSQYRIQAKQALDLRWMIVASIPRTFDTRVETLVTATEYREAMLDEVSSEDAPEPESKPIPDTDVAPSITDTKPEPEQAPLPAELSVGPQ